MVGKVIFLHTPKPLFKYKSDAKCVLSKYVGLPP
jgi:hypothetical protein